MRPKLLFSIFLINKSYQQDEVQPPIPSFMELPTPNESPYQKCDNTSSTGLKCFPDPQTAREYCELNNTETVILTDFQIPCSDLLSQSKPEFGRAFYFNNARLFTNTRITDKYIIPIIFHSSTAPNVRPNLKAAIDSQIAHMNKLLCVKFQYREGHYTSDGSEYINIQDANSGCNSPVGRNTAGVNNVNIGKGCDYTFVHEAGHSMGLHHEHQREDRGKTLRYNWQYFDSEKWIGPHNKFSVNYTEDFDRGFDSSSVMHYGTTATINGKKELKISDRFGGDLSPKPRIGKWYEENVTPTWGLSRIDILHFHDLYKCDDIKFPRNLFGHLSDIGGNFVAQIKFGDDDKFSDGTVIKGSKNLINALNWAVQLIFVGSKGFNIRYESNTLRRCYSYDGLTAKDCPARTGLDEDDFIFNFKPLNISNSKVLVYDPIRKECLDLNENVTKCNLSNETDINKCKRNFTHEEVKFEDGQFKFLKFSPSVKLVQYTLLPESDICSYQNGFCSDYCRQNGKKRECYCADGWKIDPNDSSKCIEIDECSLSTTCGGPIDKSGAKCLNLAGKEHDSNGYRCKCDWGWEFSISKNKCILPSENDDKKYITFPKMVNGVKKCLGYDDLDRYKNIKYLVCNYSDKNQFWTYTEHKELKTLSGYCLGTYSTCTDRGYYMQRQTCREGKELDQNYDLVKDGDKVKLVSQCGKGQCMNVNSGNHQSIWNQGTSCTSIDIEYISAATLHEHVSAGLTEINNQNLELKLNKVIKEKSFNKCSSSWQRIYKSNNNNELLCIDHVTGNINFITLTNQITKTIQNDDCKGDSLDVKVIVGNKFIICINYETSEFWNNWCRVGDYNATPNGKLVVGDFDNDGNDDIICSMSDGKIKNAIFVKESTNLNEMFKFSDSYTTLFAKKEYYDIFAADMNQDGRLDLFAYRNGIFDVDVLLQENSDNVVTEIVNGVCPPTDKAVDKWSITSCDYHLKTGGCQKYSNVPDVCAKTCGMCKGTKECGNNFDNVAGISCGKAIRNKLYCDVKYHWHDKNVIEHCPLACGKCTPTYTIPDKPIWPAVKQDQTLEFCIGGEKIMYIDDKSMSNKIIYLCFDWSTGTLTSSETGIIFTNFCKSKYVRNSVTQVDFKEQASGQFFMYYDDKSKNTEYMCVSRVSGKIWYTGEFDDNVVTTDEPTTPKPTTPKPTTPKPTTPKPTTPKPTTPKPTTPKPTTPKPTTPKPTTPKPTTPKPTTPKPTTPKPTTPKPTTPKPTTPKPTTPKPTTPKPTTPKPTTPKPTTPKPNTCDTCNQLLAAGFNCYQQLFKPNQDNCNCPTEQLNSFYNDKVCTKPSNPCENFGCSHACFINKSKNPTCACPQGSELLGDSKRCTKIVPVDIFDKTTEETFLVHSDSKAWGFWKDKFGKECVTVEKLKKGSKLKFDECDSENELQRFTFDPVKGLLKLYQQKKYCIGVPQKKNKLIKRKLNVTLDPCSSKIKFIEWQWDYYNSRIELGKDKVFGCLKSSFDKKGTKYVQISEICDDNIWGVIKITNPQGRRLRRRGFY